MLTKSIVLALYESSLQNRSSNSLVDGWQAIVEYHSEPEIKSLFADLLADLNSGSPSFTPYEKCEYLKSDLVIVRHFVELAANTTMYEQYWSQMCFALVLKEHLKKSEPTDKDVRLAAYLLASGDNAAGDSLSAEMATWSKSSVWNRDKMPKSEDGYDFPGEWSQQFSVDGNDYAFPPSIPAILKRALEGGTLDSIVPDVAVKWTSMVQIVDKVFPKKS